MRLADYKIKFFDYLAGNLRRLIVFLSIKLPAEKDDNANEKTFSPAEDWFEKTQNILPADWVEFSGENEPVENEIKTVIVEREIEPIIQTVNSSAADKTGEEDFVLQKLKKQPSTAISFENIRKTSKRLENSNNPEISLKGKPKEPKTDSRFFSFNLTDKNPKDENDEPPKIQSKISRKLFGEVEKTLEAARRKFRLLPAEFVSENSPKTSDPPAPNIINFAGKQSPQETKETTETTQSIVKKPAARTETSIQFPLEAFSRKNEDEQATELSFALPKRKTDSAAVFTSKAKAAPETPGFSSLLKKKQTAVQKYIKPARGKKTDNQLDEAERFVTAESPWINLSDESAFEATNENYNYLSENEHLRFLECEQAGKIQK